MTNRVVRPFGFNVIGHITGNLGLAVAARNTLQMLTQREEPVVVADIDPGLGRGGHDSTFDGLLSGPTTTPYGVNLFQLNPPEVLRLARWTPDWLDLTGCMNAIVPFWELPLLPVQGGWREVVAAVDVVMAPTRFVLDAVRHSVPEANAIHYPQTVYLPEGIRADRDSFGLPRETALFFTALDVTSDVTRKNPAGVLEAFTRAFQGDPRATLVVKLNNSGRSPFASPENDRVRELLASAPQVVVFDEVMTYERVLSLTASCDALVSLHRSEGLGLNVLEAMALSKPCVVTAWSGTMDFTTEENSCLVGYDLVPVKADHPAYQPEIVGPGQVWAAPDLDAAAEWMSRLADDPALRDAIGAKAAASLDASRVRFEDGAIVGQLKNAYETCATPQVTRRREAAWAPLRQAPASARVRRTLGKVARTLGLRG